MATNIFYFLFFIFNKKNTKKKACFGLIEKVRLTLEAKCEGFGASRACTNIACQ
jgi:hypothetical protein